MYISILFDTRYIISPFGNSSLTKLFSPFLPVIIFSLGAKCLPFDNFKNLVSYILHLLGHTVYQIHLAQTSSFSWWGTWTVCFHCRYELHLSCTICRHTMIKHGRSADSEKLSLSTKLSSTCFCSQSIK